VFGGLMDDWLLELTSAVPGAVGCTQQQQQQHPYQLQQFPTTPAFTGSHPSSHHHQQQLQQHPQQLPRLHTHYSGSSSSSSSVQRPLLHAERRCSQTGSLT
jgi:hypothetical protein